MPGYELINQSRAGWLIGENNQSIYGISQQWKQTEIGGNGYIYIKYFEFEDETKAFAGTAYNAGSYAGRYIYGSLGGEIIGDVSWVSDDGDALIFQKWNIGIQVFSPSLASSEGPESIAALSNRILSKIKDSISTEILIKDEQYIKYQLLLSEYNQFTKAGNETLQNAGLTPNKVENSKWIISGDSIVMGIRKQWSGTKANFNIDVAKFSNPLDAQQAVKYRDSLTWNSTCLLADSKSVERAIKKWVADWPINLPMKYIYLGGYINNYSAHYYYFNEAGIDTAFFKDVVLSATPGETGIRAIENSGIKSYPNPARKTFTLEVADFSITQCQLFNAKLQLLENLEVNTGKNTYNISHLKEGIYLLKIRTGGETVVRKIIKVGN